MQVTEQERDGQPPPGGGGRQDTPAARLPGVHLRPVLAAVVVLMLWLAWLLVPVPAGDEPAVEGAPLPTSRGGPVADGADPTPTVPGPRASTGTAPTGTTPTGTTPTGTTPSEGGPSEASATARSQAPAEAVVVPQRGSGSFDVAPGESERVGSSGTLVTYSVEVEGGIPLDAAEVAEVVDAVLADERSWTSGGEWSLQRTDEQPQVRIRVSTPDTTDALCAPLNTNGEVSCRNGADVVLNALRWTTGARSWGEDVVGYREYLVNHELGHFLGNGHVDCPDEGEPAPVMQQQTLGLQGCAANGWPFP